MLVAQIVPQEFPTNPQSGAPPVVRAETAVPSTDLFDQPPAKFPERTAQPAAHAAIGSATTPIHSQSSLARAEALVEQFVAWDLDAIEGKPFTLLACVERAATNFRHRLFEMNLYVLLRGAARILGGESVRFVLESGRSGCTYSHRAGWPLLAAESPR